MKKLLFFTFLAIFIGTLGIYVASPITAHTDSLWSLYLATSFIKTGNFNLDEYSDMIPSNDYRTERVNGHIYSTYPIGTPLMTVPVIFILDHLSVINGLNLSAFLANHPPGPDEWQVEKFVASIIVSLNAVIMFAMGLKYLNVVKSAILTILFALATSAWSTASRGLWQHGPSMLCISLALYLIILARRNPALSPLVALPLAFSYVVRPTNSISIVILTLYMFIVHRRYFLYYVLLLIVCLAPFFVYNYSVYQKILPNYYLPQILGNLKPGPLLGTLISPSRGLIFFSPIFLLSFFGVYRRLSQAGILFYKEIEIYLVAIIAVHWLVISAFPVWYGGWSIGPRYFSDMIPYLIFLIIPFLEILPLSLKNSIIQKSVIPVLICIAIFSIFIQYRCSTNIGPTQWNGKPNDIDYNQYRLWDWGDIQFLRNLCLGQDYQAPKCWLKLTNKGRASQLFYLGSISLDRIPQSNMQQSWP
jgi:hypothetical protein